MASKHVTCAQTAEKVFCSTKSTRTSNPEPNKLSDQHNMSSEPNNVLAEDYNIIEMSLSENVTIKIKM